MASAMGTRRINMDLDEKLWLKLDVFSRETGVSKREILERLLEDKLTAVSVPGGDYKPLNKQVGRSKSRVFGFHALRDGAGL